jgi:dynein heavy chain
MFSATGALKVSQINDSKFFRILENTLKFGQPFLCENVGEELDPLIEPILLKNLIKKGS